MSDGRALLLAVPLRHLVSAAGATAGPAILPAGGPGDLDGPPRPACRCGDGDRRGRRGGRRGDLARHLRAARALRAGDRPGRGDSADLEREHAVPGLPRRPPAGRDPDDIADSTRTTMTTRTTGRRATVLPRGLGPAAAPQGLVAVRQRAGRQAGSRRAVLPAPGADARRPARLSRRRSVDECLDLEVLGEAEAAHLPPEPGLLVAAERRPARPLGTVDADASRADPAGDPVGTLLSSRTRHRPTARSRCRWRSRPRPPRRRTR